MTIRPGEVGADGREGQRAERQAEGAQRQEAVLDLRPREPAGQHAAGADAQPSATRGRLASSSDEAQDLRGVGQDRRGHEAGDRPDQDLADDASASARGRRGWRPSRAARSRPARPRTARAATRGIVSAASSPQTESAGEQEAAHPEPDEPAWPRQPRRVPRPHWRITAPATIPLRIARFEPISSTPLAAESRSWGTSSGMIPYLAGPNSAAWTPSRPRITSAAGRLRPGDQHRDARQHQRQLEDLGADDDRPLAEPVGQHARRHRDEHQRDHQDDLGDRRVLLPLLRARGRGDRQQDHDLLPGIVVERPEELGHEQPAHRMLQRPAAEEPGRGCPVRRIRHSGPGPDPRQPVDPRRYPRQPSLSPRCCRSRPPISDGPTSSPHYHVRIGASRATTGGKCTAVPAGSSSVGSDAGYHGEGLRMAARGEGSGASEDGLVLFTGPSTKCLRCEIRADAGRRDCERRGENEDHEPAHGLCEGEERGAGAGNGEVCEWSVDSGR